MKVKFKDFSYPYSNIVMVSSAIILFGSLFIIPIFDADIVIKSRHFLKYFLLGITLISMLGFIYSTLAFHYKTKKGDELKFRIHLESLNIAFTSSLVSLFALIFIMVNFWPVGLNYILIFIAVIGIISYVIAVELIKEKYQ